MHSANLLVIDQSPESAEHVNSLLRNSGIKIHVLHVSTSTEVKRALDKDVPVLILFGDPDAHPVGSEHAGDRVQHAGFVGHVEPEEVLGRGLVDRADRRRLEGWTHPRVRATISPRLREARAAGIPRVVLDVPLLLENDPEHGLVEACDVLVFVDVPLEERRRRAATRAEPPLLDSEVLA